MTDASSPGFSILVALLPFLFFFLWLAFFQRGAPPKIPRYELLLGFAVAVPLGICLLVFGFVFAANSPPDAILPEAPIVVPAAPEVPPPQVLK
jgi:hypothetical protein